MNRRHHSLFSSVRPPLALLLAVLTISTCVWSKPAPAQTGEDSGPQASEAVEAPQQGSDSSDDTKPRRGRRIKSGQTTIIVEGNSETESAATFYTAKAVASATFSESRVTQSVDLMVNLVQGDDNVVSFGLEGSGEVVSVTGDTLKSWSVRNENGKRRLDLQLTDDAVQLKANITMRSEELALPTEMDLLHLSPAEAIAFDSTVTLNVPASERLVTTNVDGFVPLKTETNQIGFQTSTGGQLRLRLTRRGITTSPIEFFDATLEGAVDPNASSISFRLNAKAVVKDDGESMTFLSGNAAISNATESADFALSLVNQQEGFAYVLSFPKAGEFDLSIDFVAAIQSVEQDQRQVDFKIATGAVVPVVVNGMDTDLEFVSEGQFVVPRQDNDAWKGFLPATGNVAMRWKSSQKTEQGKLFFTTNGKIETSVGAGLLRQRHLIDYRVLQGELATLELSMNGPGEVLDVQGANLIAWQVKTDGDQRVLEIRLAQPIKTQDQISVRTQTTLDAFPVRVEGLRLTPQNTIRHSGFLRLTNSGSVTLEPVDLSGLTQLAPDQFPAEPIEARQVFVYRFPSADYSFFVAADRVQPEVSVSAIVTYEVGEADRSLHADVELDIREAPIRDWAFSIPADYSVVSVTGSSVLDYVASNDIEAQQRELTVMFGGDVAGRQLVSLHLEKNVAAAAGPWELPKLMFPEAKTVRGDIGLMGAAGIRVSMSDSNFLVEKPVAYFPKNTPGLQQAFRLRQEDWSATASIELLQRNVQSDVFHLYSLNRETLYGSALINYFVTGAPVSEWRIAVPENFGNIVVDGQDVRTWRRDGGDLVVTLHQPVMGAYTLLVTFEQDTDEASGDFVAGQVAPQGVDGERGFLQVVSPMQVELKTVIASNDLLELDPLELPAEFRLLSTAPALGTWQYTERPFELRLNVNWFRSGATVPQIVEFSEATSQVSQDGELVTDVLYYVKSRGQRNLRLRLPADPVRLWQVSVNGAIVTARQSDETTLIPLPGNTDPNEPIEVRLRLGKPSVDPKHPSLALPILDAPVLKTQWSVQGDENHVLVPDGGNVQPPAPVTRPSGFHWTARYGLPGMVLILIFTLVGIWGIRTTGWRLVVGSLSTTVAVLISLYLAGLAWAGIGSPQPLEMSIPVVSAGESIVLEVANLPSWTVDVSWVGVVLAAVGLLMLAVWCVKRSDGTKSAREQYLSDAYKIAIVLLVSCGILLQGGGAPWFFAISAVALFAFGWVPAARKNVHEIQNWFKLTADKLQRNSSKDPESPSTGEGGLPTGLLLGFLLLSLPSSHLVAQESMSYQAASVIEEHWNVDTAANRLTVDVTMELVGKPGDAFIVLKSPAILTAFKSDELRISKTALDDQSIAYVTSLPISDEDDSTTEKRLSASLTYQVDSVNATNGLPILTGMAAVHRLDIAMPKSTWEVTSPAAVRIESTPATDQPKVQLLLGPNAHDASSAIVYLRPKARDVSSEATVFFVEATDLYLPGPGVVDGNHRLQIRPSQGQLNQLSVLVPAGLTVSDVGGPVRSWQFDAEQRRLAIQLEPPQAAPFAVTVQTQRGLATLPTDLELSNLQVENADGQIGLLGIAFGPDAQPEGLQTEQLSAVNLNDFDLSMLPDTQSVLHRVYRYGAEGGKLTLNVAPVKPEVRVISQQVLSFGDERIVLSVALNVEISRAGLFTLTFPIPDGVEIESLSGNSLHHWAEVTENGQRQAVLHLNGKTIGAQQFAITLIGNTPADVTEWTVPKLVLNQSTRQTGELVVRPTTGIRLRTLARENISETDPRSLGGAGQGVLAFRLLQRDWSLQLGIEKLAPWITGEVLHEVSLREGQTRSALMAKLEVQNASVRSIQVELPGLDEDEIKTLRAVGEAVSDFVHIGDEGDLWELQFKRRVVGGTEFRIEFERRGERTSGAETLTPIRFPSVKQLTYYVAVRAGGRLELESPSLPDGWQRVDWNAIPAELRNSGNRNSPSLSFRANVADQTIQIAVARHALAESLKLRVAEGTLTTVLSSTGDQITGVDLTMDVIQRSSLTVELPAGSTLFNVFVNGESVNSIRLGESSSTWQFYVLPGLSERSANVKFTYSVTGSGISDLRLTSPLLNVPLENIHWNVVAPTGFALADNGGDLELVEEEQQLEYDRGSYLSKTSSRRNKLAAQATQLLEQANEFLQAGDQAKASWALNSVANQYALDAASNEDARVQLEKVQTQQAIVGLNTRRQRMYLDNRPSEGFAFDNKQLRDAAAINPILQQNELNFRPQQISELLQGNTLEDNAVLSQIATRLVQHQHGSEPAPQAITISLPEEGTMYRFSRTVQVAESEALALELEFERQWDLRPWQIASLLGLLAMLGVAFALLSSRRPSELA